MIISGRYLRMTGRHSAQSGLSDRRDTHVPCGAPDAEAPGIRRKTQKPGIVAGVGKRRLGVSEAAAYGSKSGRA